MGGVKSKCLKSLCPVVKEANLGHTPRVYSQMTRIVESRVCLYGRVGRGARKQCKSFERESYEKKRRIYSRHTHIPQAERGDITNSKIPPLYVPESTHSRRWDLVPAAAPPCCSTPGSPWRWAGTPSPNWTPVGRSRMPEQWRGQWAWPKPSQSLLGSVPNV